MATLPTTGELRRQLEELKAVTEPLREEASDFIYSKSDEIPIPFLLQLSLLMTLQKLNESSKRLEGLTRRLNWFTWALIVLTTFLFATEIVAFLKD
ncbi:MAG: hypothetical protein HY535_06410 [Chloroflexi bacterium]|nr:hypothetical protein [Chloroflexota bacterium]